MEACPSADKIAELVDGALGLEEAGGVHKHVRGCSTCRAVIAVLGAEVILDTSDPSMTNGPGSPPPDERDPLDTPPSLGPFGPGGGVPPLKPGAQVGRFRIERMLGRGGMGTVWSAADPELGRKVAIKILVGAGAGGGSEGDSEQSASRERLLREAQAMARLSHPNVVPVFEIGEGQGRLFLVMELVVGETLAHWLREKHPLLEVLDKFIAAGQGLAAAHAAGVIHRDFKPENVLVGSDGSVRVTDFGLAREHLPELVETLPAPESQPPAPPAEVEMQATLTPMGLTPLGALLGTPAYMSPEQMAGKRADARSDLFAFCTALYEALIGVRPFVAMTLAETRRQIEVGNLQWPRESRVPRGLRRVIALGLKADPLRRQQSMEELLQALRRERARSARRLILPAAIAVAVVVAAVGITVVIRKPPAPRPARSIAVLLPRDASAPALGAGWMAPVFAETIASELDGSSAVRLIPGDEVALATNDLDLRGAVPLAADVERLRLRLGAEVIADGKYTLDASGKLTAELQLWDHGDSATLLSASGNGAHLLAVAAQLGEEVRQTLGIGKKPASEPLFSDLEVARHYAVGLQLVHDFQSAQAVEELKRAAALAPANPRVQLALADTYSYLQQGEPARAAAQRAFELKDALTPEEQVHAALVYYRTSGDQPRAIDLARERHLAEPGNLQRGLELAVEYSRAFHYDKLLALTQELQKLPPPAGEDPRIDWRQAAACNQLMQLDCAKAAAERAFLSAQKIGARWQMGAARAEEGWAVRRSGDFDRAMAIFEEAHRLFDASGDRASSAGTQMSLASIYADRGDLPRARKMFEGVLATFGELGNRRSEAQVLQNLAVVMRRAHDLPAALSYADRSAKLNIEFSALGPAASSLNTLGGIKGDMGDFAGAADALTQACDMRRTQKSPLLISCLASLNDMLLWRSDFAQAQKFVDEARTASVGKEKVTVARSHHMASVLAFDQGRYAAAISEGQAEAALFRETASSDDEALAQSLLARSELTLGHAELARPAVERAQELIKNSKSLLARGPVSIADALLLAAEHPNDLAEPLGILHAVVSEAEHSGVVDERWQAQLGIARIELTARLPGARARMLAFAREARAAGVLLYAQQAEEAARASR